MTVRKVVLVCAALAIAAAAAGQTDRISGKWGSDGQTLLDLKFDGDATVTGMAYSASARTPIRPPSSAALSIRRLEY
jgi:hypothetical protein